MHVEAGGYSITGLQGMGLGKDGFVTKKAEWHGWDAGIKVINRNHGDMEEAAEEE